MYDKNLENDIRGTEIALGNPPNRGISESQLTDDTDSKVLFTAQIDYKEGTFKVIPAK